ncbi:MAG: ABC transporter ATP-binding protein [Candidatus Omnitrophica bacterium]|nr:ABC transporter ATP-binding protein [Candidatus Omnitrophota bacterium]
MIKNKLFFKFARYLLPYWKSELLILILSSLTVLFALVNPYFGKLIMDKAIIGKDLKNFVIFFSASALVFVVSGVVKAAADYLERVVKFKVTVELTRDLFVCFEKLSINWFQGKSTGEHVYKITYDSERIAELITAVPRKIITILGGILFTCLVLFYLDWRITLLSWFIMLVMGVSQYYFNRKLKNIGEDIIKNTEFLFKKLTELFSHIKLVKAFGSDGAEIKKYLHNWLINMHLQLKNSKLDILAVFAGNAISKVVIGGIVFYGGYQVIRGRLTLGTLTVVIVYLSQLFGLVENFASFWRVAIRGFISCGRVEQLISEEAKVVESAQAQEILMDEGRIVVENLSFGYKSIPVLEKLSFVIEPGSCVAIAGRSGSGKTTLLNLLLRLYDPWQGGISIDGHNIKEFKFISLRSQIGIAMQEPFLWEDSIFNNIKYPLERVSNDQVVWAARMTGADQFINNLPNKYSTIIGENGCKLSEGQKQKIAIARALIKNPKILILDEAMSSMDSESEEQIIKNIRQAYSKTTFIIVSHRLSAIHAADLVYFIKNPYSIVIAKSEQIMRNEKELYDLFAPQIKLTKS